ncbi:hypothetical protein MAPG_07880, partial [Magnaporthiopsis poae ATCC 64411]
QSQKLRPWCGSLTAQQKSHRRPSPNHHRLLPPRLPWCVEHDDPTAGRFLLLHRRRCISDAPPANTGPVGPVRTQGTVKHNKVAAEQNKPTHKKQNKTKEKKTLSICHSIPSLSVFLSLQPLFPQSRRRFRPPATAPPPPATAGPLAQHDRSHPSRVVRGGLVWPKPCRVHLQELAGPLARAPTAWRRTWHIPLAREAPPFLHLGNPAPAPVSGHRKQAIVGPGLYQQPTPAPSAPATTPVARATTGSQARPAEPPPRRGR